MLEIALGLSSGYTFAVAKNKEDEVKQGKNYIQGACCQALQVSRVSNVTGMLINKIPHPAIRIPANIINSTLPFSSWVFCPVAALVKQGSFEGTAKVINDLGKARFPSLTNFYVLPEKLDDSSTGFFNYMAEHTGDISRIALLSSVAMLPFFGSPLFAASVLSPVLYEAMDSKGYVPRRLSLFIETYLPALSNISLFLGGGLTSQIISTLSLASYSPQLNRMAHQKLDDMTSYYFSLEGPSLRLIDGPLENTRELNLKEIIEILDADPENFEINVAHCSKWANGLSRIPEDRDFNKLLKLFDAIPWNQKYGMLKHGFQDDDRFVDFLREKFPDKNDHQSHFEHYIELCAQEIEITKEQFLSNQLYKQMTLLTKTLLGEIRPKGSQKDLDEAITSTAKIVYHLSNLDAQKDYIEIEDTLFKLAIEGGEYCARGVKRASGELLNGIFQQGLKGKGIEVNPISDYENRIRQALQKCRSNILEGLFLSSMEALLREFGAEAQAVAVTQDIHTFDAYRKYFALGFYPLTDYERDGFGIGDLMNWEQPAYRHFRSLMLKDYENSLESTVQEAVREIGLIHFPEYIQRVLRANKKLTEEDIRIIMENKYATANDFTWEYEETQEKFYRLMLVFLGVLQKKKRPIPLAEDWTEVVREEAQREEAQREEAQRKESHEKEEWALVESM